MGEVYRGFHEKLERRVAVKTIRSEHRLSGELKSRFLREARLLSKLGHPGICQVYDLIETPEADFLVLEYVEGRTLKQIEPGELSFEQKLRLAEKTATALAAAHHERIVHRDLKADNVMFTAGGEVKVLDFGIARSVAESGSRSVLDSSIEVRRLTEGADLTQHGALIGTAKAMSPEQAEGGRVTMASDLYSLGILLQELFTGEPAYEAANPVALLAQVVRAETRPIEGIDPDLTRLIHDLQSLDPRRRPTAEQTAERLRWILDEPQRRRRRRLVAAAAVAAFTLLAALLAVVSYLAIDARNSREDADRRRAQAEQLIGFMLGDLRPKLEPLGRVDLLDEIGDRALDYFASIPESDLTDGELSQRVKTILQIAEVRHAQGRLPDAIDAAARALVLARSLAERDPAEERWQMHLVDAYTWAGQVLFDQGRADDALAEWRQGLEVARGQLERHPESPRWLTATASSQHNVGTALEAAGDLAGALRSYRESLDLNRSLAAKSPEDRDRQAGLAATLAWVSNALERQGDLEGALVERQAHLEILARLAELEPASAIRQQDLASARGFLAGLLVPLGDLEEARSLYEAGLATIDGLAARDPGNAGLQRWLAAFHSALGALAAEEGDPARGLPALRTARAILVRLVAQDATNVDWRLQLGVCHRRLAAAVAETDAAAARAEAHQAVEILSALLEEAPDEATRGHLAEAEIALGRAELALGDPGRARSAWERALAVLKPSRHPLTHWRLLDPQARALLHLDRLKEAELEVRSLLRMGYEGRELRELSRRKGLALAPGP